MPRHIIQANWEQNSSILSYVCTVSYPNTTRKDEADGNMLRRTAMLENGTWQSGKSFLCELPTALPAYRWQRGWCWNDDGVPGSRISQLGQVREVGSRLNCIACTAYWGNYFLKNFREVTIKKHLEDYREAIVCLFFKLSFYVAQGGLELTMEARLLSN